MKATLMERVRRGDFEADLRAGELRDGGRTVRLQEQPFQILCMLIARDGDVVMREEIRRKLWPNDTVVEFDHSINAAIKKLRQALGDSADDPRYVETVARRGYRLLIRVAEMAAVKDEASSDPSCVSDTGAVVAQTAAASWDLVGTTVSHYRVLGIIGGGGMGLVYEAEDLKLGRHVALKFLPGELARNPIALQRFEREAKAASSLNHRNICTIYEIEEHEEQPFLVMELLSGETLRDRMALADEQPLAVDEVLAIARQMCEGLQAAHAQGIIHRDIKPANIFLTKSGEVKILDFGLAKLVSNGKEAAGADVQYETDVSESEPQPAGPVTPEATLTRLGSAMGTAGYMSPEQVRGGKLDARSDVFSLGLVLYEMATGQRAFGGETEAAVQEGIVNRALTPAKELNAELPEELEAVIRRALEKDREKRTQSAEELGCELRRIQSEDAAPRASSGGRWVRWTAAAVMVLGLAASLVGARLVWRPAAVAAEVKEQQITANPLEDPVLGAAVSPDGKYLAYQDQTGLYLRAMDSGEIRPVALPAELRNKIFYLSWFPGSAGLLADVEGENGGFDTWIIPIVGEAEPRLQPAMAGSEPRLLYRRAAAGGISPDGRMIAFTRGEFGRQWKTVWVGGINGEAPRKLVSVGEEEEVASPVWSPDGNWIAYGRSWKTPEGSWSSSIEARPAAGGAAKTLVTEASLSAKDGLSLAVSPWLIGGWTADGRLLFTVAQGAGSPSVQTRYSLWDVQVDARTGSPDDKPRQVSGWSESKPRNVTVTSDGKRLTMLRERLWLDTYVGALAAEGTRMKTPRRFTLDDRGSSASGWTRDGQAVVFDSPRNGKREIFSQSANENVVERMVMGSGDVNGGVMSPDGARLLYWESVAGTSDGMVRLMSQEAGGGRAEILLEAPAQEHRHALACSSNPHAIAPCVMSLTEGKDLVFYAVDPLRGKGSRLGKIEVFGAYEDWGLSPDGASVALVDADKYDGRIEVLNLANGAWREILVGPGGEHLQSIAWAADGKSFFATPHSPYLYNVLHITLTGKVQRLLDSGRPQWMVSPLPSPDGKYLAFDAQTWDSNVWMIDKF